VGSQLERTINRWASEVLFITPAPAAALQEAVLTDLTDVGESAALFTNVRPMIVQGLLRHAMAEVISDGIINSLIVTNSAEANLEFRRIHERLFARTFPSHPLKRRMCIADAPSPPNLQRQFLVRLFTFLGGRVLVVFLFRGCDCCCGLASPHVLRCGRVSPPRDDAEDL